MTRGGDGWQDRRLAEHVTIAPRFRGPPDSGHGGYSAGLVAERIDAACAAVSLRLPPPLERPLEVVRNDDAVALVEHGNVVAEGAPASLDLEVPAPVSIDDAQRAAGGFAWAHRHPFPGCFGCGTHRSQDEAVAITVGPVDGRDVFAGPWTPLAEFADGDGAVAPLFVWSALDCPTYWGALHEADRVAVIGRLTCRLIAPIEPERPHVVVAWPLGADGRKHRGAAAIHTADGELRAYSEGLWIELRDPSTMGARTGQ